MTGRVMAADAKRICEMAAKRLRHNVWSWDVLLYAVRSTPEQRVSHEAGGEGRRRRKPRRIAQSQDILVMLTETSQEAACREVATCEGIDDECDSQAPSRAKKPYIVVCTCIVLAMSGVEGGIGTGMGVRKAGFDSCTVSQSVSVISVSISISSGAPCLLGVRCSCGRQ